MSRFYVDKSIDTDGIAVLSVGWADDDERGANCDSRFLL